MSSAVSSVAGASSGAGSGAAVTPVVSAVTPAPTDEEMVAIVAALELAWPRPVVLLSTPTGPSKAASWRWSGRWWAASRR
jgi:hypothetical protein